MRFLIPADKTALCLNSIIMSVLSFPKKTVPQSRGTAKTKRDLAVIVEGKAIKGYLIE